MSSVFVDQRAMPAHGDDVSVQESVLNVQQFVAKWMWPCVTLLINIPQIFTISIVMSQVSSDKQSGGFHQGMSLSTWVLVKMVWVIGNDVLLAGSTYFKDQARVRRGEPPQTATTAIILITIIRVLFDKAWWSIGWAWWSYTHMSLTEASIARLVLYILCVDTITFVILEVIPLCLVGSMTCFVVWISHRLPSSVPPLRASEVQYVLMKEPYKATAGCSTSCSICLTDFENDEEIGKLSCQVHSFHVTCITGWLTQRGNCPNCRAVATTQPIAAGIEIV